MDIGIVHTHTLVVALYILLMAAKTAVLLTNQKGLFATLNGKTKIPRIVLEALMFGTGVYLLIKSPAGTDMLHIVKYGLLVAGTVLAIIASRKLNKGMAVASLLIFVYIFMAARTHSLTLQSEASRIAALSAAPDRGKQIYEIACQRCHGPSGDATFRKAMSLKASGLNPEGMAITIKAGRKMMPAFEYLTDEQVQEVVAYVGAFKTGDAPAP